MDSVLEAVRSLLTPPDGDRAFESEGAGDAGTVCYVHQQSAQGSQVGLSVPTAATTHLAAVTAAASHAQMLETLAHELQRHLDKDQRGSLDRAQLRAVSDSLRSRLGLPRLADVELYLAVIACDHGGSNKLDCKATAAFIGDQLRECATALGGHVSTGASPCTTPRQTPRTCHPRAPPPSPTEAMMVTLRTLAGNSCQATLSASATTEDLKLAVARSPLGIGYGQHLLAAGGSVLADGAQLQQLGIGSGSIVDVVRLTPAPELVRLECKGLGCGPSIRGSCGTFRRARTSRLKNGRPIYIRDSSLSQWNMAMKYHGDGQRYLVYEEHESQGKRWALTDDKDWNGYGDRSYAFVASEASHPGYLEGRLWCIYRDAKYQGGRVWVEHESLALTIEAD